MHYGHILVLDDDESLCEVLKEFLLKNNFRVSIAYTPSKAFELLNADQSINMIIIDIMLPEQDGLSVCKEVIKSDKYHSIPIIMLTARASMLDCVIGLEVGADDYITKPFEPRELLARIRSLIRRATSSTIKYPPRTFSTNTLHMEDNLYKAWLKGKDLQLTSMEYRLLKLLTSAPIGTIISREEISLYLYEKTNHIYSRSIDAIIMRLRHKLHDNPKKPDFIKTVRGKGYYFIYNDDEKD